MKRALISLLQVLGVVAVIAAAVWWQMRPGEDERVVARVTELTEAMCACTELVCAQDVKKQFNEIVGTKLKSRDDGLSSAWSKAQFQVGYMVQCHDYLLAGTRFDVERDYNGAIRIIRPEGVPGGVGTFDISEALRATP